MQPEVLWRWPELCEAVGIPIESGPDASGVSIDSRTLEPGDLFIALAGDPGPGFHTHSRSARDGHDFIPDAVRKGAIGVLAHKPHPAIAPTLIVPDTLEGLWALGRAARHRLTGPVFAVTGSSGKTTARTWLMAALDCAGSEGSFNNFWGVPLSLARTAAGAGPAVFEIGTNHPGEIEPLAKMVSPSVAIVLNVGLAHIENFSSQAALRAEKLSITRGLIAKGTAVVPDDLDLATLTGAARIVKFGFTAAADIRVVDYDARHRVARMATPAGEIDVAVPGGGRHRAATLAAVVAALCAAGASPALAARLSEESIPTGRGRRESIGTTTLIDDSYNANPSSMAAALALLADDPAPRIAILGEMLELGSDSARYHRELAAACASCEGVICVGAGMRHLFDALPAAQRISFVDKADDIDLTDFAARFEGATLLLKGSNRVFWASGFGNRLRSALGRSG